MSPLVRNALALIVCAAGGAVLWNTVAKTAEPPATAVAPEAPPRPAPARIAGPGRVEPESGEIDICAEVSGVIASVTVHEGDPVMRGEVLAELSNDDLKARVAQAQASLQLKKSQYDKLRNGSRQEDINQANATVDGGNASLKLAQQKLARQKSMHAQGFAAAGTLDEAQSAYDQEASRLQSARQSLAALLAGPRTEDVAAAKSDVDLAQAQLDEANAALEKSRIKAPFDGLVLRRYKEPGESVTAGPNTPVLQVGDMNRLIVRVQVDESDIAGLKTGEPAEVTAPAWPGRKFSGHVTHVSPRLGTKTITTGAPTEKHDTRVLDTLIALDPGTNLPVGLRVDAIIDTSPAR